MFFDEADVEERQVAFDCLVKVIAKRKDMCCSSSLLNFLGFSLLADKEYFKVYLFFVSALFWSIDCGCPSRLEESFYKERNNSKRQQS